MPRGGKQVSDGFSPYKHPDGRELRLLKSSKSNTGYFRVVKVGNLFYPKAKLDGVKGSKSQKLFGKGKKEAREAAIILAEYLDSPYALPSAPPRQPHSSQLTTRQLHEKKMKKVDVLRAEACSLLGVSEEMSAEEEADAFARAAEFAAWQQERLPDGSVFIPASMVELGDHGDIHVSV